MSPGQKAQGNGERKYTAEEAGSRPLSGQCYSQGSPRKKIISPDRKRQSVKQAIQILDVSERRACRVVGQSRTTQRYNKRPADDEDFLTSRIIELASRYGRYGYRRVTALLRNEGWIINHKRVERIWRREGLKVPQKQPERGRLWLNDGSVVQPAETTLPAACLEL